MELTVRADGLAGFRKRSLERARKMDQGERLMPERIITFQNPLEMSRLLTPERVRLYQTVRRQETSVTNLAHGLKRDRSSVSRDVRELESKGLLKTHRALNPGHGTVKMVATSTDKLVLMAEL